MGFLELDWGQNTGSYYLCGAGHGIFNGRNWLQAWFLVSFDRMFKNQDEQSGGTSGLNVWMAYISSYKGFGFQLAYLTLL